MDHARMMLGSTKPILGQSEYTAAISEAYTPVTQYELVARLVSSPLNMVLNILYCNFR